LTASLLIGFYLILSVFDVPSRAVRSFLTWLLVFGIFAAALARTMPHQESTVADCSPTACGHSHSTSVMEESASCCEQGSDEQHAPDNSGDCQHHHHVCCGGPLAFGEDLSQITRTAAPSHLKLQLDGILIPDSPVYELDTPPLI